MLNVDRSLSQAYAHEKKGSLGKAQKLYLKILSVFPQNTRAKVALQRIQNTNVKPALTPPKASMQKLLEIYSNHDFVSVINLCGRLLEYYPKAPIIWNMLGAAQYEMNDLKNAFYAFEKVTQLAPDDPDGHNNLGNVFRSKNQLKQAENSYQTAIRLKPNYPEALNSLGLVVAEGGRLEEAIKAYDAAISLKPDYVSAFVRRENLLVQLVPKKLHLFKPYAEQAQKLRHYLARDPLHQIYCAVGSFVLNDRQRCKNHLQKFDALDASHIDIALTAKEKKFCFNYNRFLKLLVANPENHGHSLFRKAYHIGESHCLSYSHSRIRINSQDYIILPKIVFGAKSYHFCKNNNNRFKELTKINLRAIPKNSTVLLSFGEIDCRHDEGILPTAEKLGCGLEDLVQETVTGYVNWFLTVNEANNHKYNFFNVPAPVYNHSLSQKLNWDVSLVVRLFNEALKSALKNSSIRIIDVYNPTSNPKGFSNGFFHCDENHLDREILTVLNKQKKSPKNDGDSGTHFW